MWLTVAACWSNDDVDAFLYQINGSKCPAFAVTRSNDVFNAIITCQPLSLHLLITTAAFRIKVAAKYNIEKNNFLEFLKMFCNEIFSDKKLSLTGLPRLTLKILLEYFAVNYSTVFAKTEVKVMELFWAHSIEAV